MNCVTQHFRNRYRVRQLATEILGHTVLYKLPNPIPVTEILGQTVLYKLPNPIPNIDSIPTPCQET